MSWFARKSKDDDVRLPDVRNWGAGKNVSVRPTELEKVRAANPGMTDKEIAQRYRKNSLRQTATTWEYMEAVARGLDDA